MEVDLSTIQFYLLLGNLQIRVKEGKRKIHLGTYQTSTGIVFPSGKLRFAKAEILHKIADMAKEHLMLNA